MGNKSLIANLIAKCDREIDAKCVAYCGKCKYWKICTKVMKLNAKFTEKGYLK